ncbi:EutN/CcmL family microcompartment protein [bacterium]|nr:EutN/CcmL family microcompartment protein [candidate division CSSED10-310 bacterium]
MFLAKIKKRVVSTRKHPAYNGKHVFVVQPVNPDLKAVGNEWVAVDYVGASIGDIVVCGGAPGVAQQVFQLDYAPIRTLIMAIVDKIDFRDFQ